MHSDERNGSTAEVTIIGAGIVGVVCANVLCREGYSVTIVDEREPGMACSYGNGGAVGPDHCVPMGMPGMLWNVPRWLLSSTGPLSLDPIYFPRAIPWLVRWALCSRMDRARRSAAAMYALHKTNLNGYRSLLGGERFSSLLRTDGHLHVYESDIIGSTESLARAFRQELGVQFTDLGADAIHEMEPALARIYKRGTFYPNSAHTINPLRLVQELFAVFREMGGKFKRAQVHGFDFDSSGPTTLQTDRGNIPFKKLVISAGAWSHRLTAMLGTKIPLEAERGYHVMFRDADVSLNHKIMNGTHSFGATAMEDGLQITGTVEIAGVDAPPNEQRAKALWKLGARMLPGIKESNGVTWMGCRPSLPDSLPILDRSPNFSNVVFNFGHSHWGLNGAPVSAEIVAALIADRDSPIERRPYRVDRF
jgi:D-amino-acid dehydrogenase